MSAAPPRLRFRRSARIKQSRDFNRTRQKGQRAVCGCLIANWLVLPQGSTPRLGLVVSSKVGDAAVRSRSRRLLRESYRLHQHEISQPVDLILVARQSINAQKLQVVERDFLTVMKRAGLLTPSPEGQSDRPHTP